MKNIFTHKREKQLNNAFKVHKNALPMDQMSRIEQMSRTVRIGAGPFADGLFFNKSVLHDSQHVETEVLKEK